MTGTIGAQAVGVLAIPAIAALYAPDAFGEFSTIWVGGLTVGSLAGLRYERAIVVAKSERMAEAVSKIAERLIVVVAAASAVILAAIRLLAGASLDRVATEAAGLGLLVLLFGLYQPRSQWAVRHGKFRQLATSEVLGTGTTVLAQVVLALAAGSTPESLLIGGLLGRAIQLVVISRRSPARDVGHLARVAVAYRQFPLFSAPYSLVSVGVSRALVLVAALMLEPKTVGFIAIAHRLTYLPITTTVNALRRVYVSVLARGLGGAEIEGQTLRLGAVMAWLALPAAFGIGVIVPGVVDAGVLDEWVGAGEFVVLLLPGALAMLITAWLDRVYEVARRQQLAFTMEAASTLIIVASYWILLSSGATAQVAVGVFGFMIAAYNALWLWVTWSVAGFDRSRALRQLGTPVGWLLLLAAAWVLGPAHLVFRAAVVLIGGVAFGAGAWRFAPKRVPVAA